MSRLSTYSVEVLLAEFSDLLATTNAILSGYWWLWGFLLLAFLAPAYWLVYVQAKYRKENKYVLLELKMPREIRKTPRAMEQVFTTIHALRNSPANFEERWLQGEVTLQYSAEMASFGGEVHLYMWIPQRHRSMIEAAIYAQYPDLEITTAEDYVNRLPPTFHELRTKGYDIFGNEPYLAKDDVYPIRTYIDFEAVAEEKELDPIANLIELMGNIKPQEQLWYQVIVQPLADYSDVGEPNYIEQWKEKGQAVLNEMKKKARGEKDPETGEIFFVMPSPGETETMKAIDRNIGKPAFNTVIRYIYIAPKEIYSANFGQRGVYSAINQYATESFNKFRHNIDVWTRASIWYRPYLFPKKRLNARKESIWRRYRIRKVYDDTLLGRILDVGLFHFSPKVYRTKRVMNTESLATIFHPPTSFVLTAPFVKRQEARKGGAPAGLAIYGSEDEESLPGIQ